MVAENRNLVLAEVGLQLADLDNSSLGGYSEGEWPAWECYLTQHVALLMSYSIALLQHSHIIYYCCHCDDAAA